jgi:hypothetical protein
MLCEDDQEAPEEGGLCWVATIFLLAYWASTNETTGVMPANMVLGQELGLPCDLMFGDPPDK